MLNTSIAKRLDSNDSDWKYLKDHINENINSLNNCSDVDFTDKERAAILCMGRQEAIRILKEILEPFDETEDVTNDDAEMIAKKTGVL